MKNKIDIERYYKRNIDEELLTWSKNIKQKTIALIGGARRTGKTYSLQFLGETRYKNYVIIEVQNLSLAIVKKLMDKENRVKNFLDYLLSRFGILPSEINEDLLIIFDEIQEHSELKESISILNNKLKCRFACTGSALWIDDTNGTRSTPDYKRFDVYPFSFNQFLNIIGEGVELFENEKKLFLNKQKINSNSKLLKLFRKYIVVGGMPQAIQHYLDNVDSDDLYKTLQDIKKTSIVNTYENDLNRYSKLFKEPLYDLYRNIIAEIGKPKNRDNLSAPYSKLSQMNVVILSQNLLNINRKLSLSIDSKMIKPYLLDIGILFYYLCEKMNPGAVELTCRSFINGKDSDDNGYLFENYVASTLVQHGYTPYFKLFEDMNEDKIKNYEIDFVFEGMTETIAIEAKSGFEKEHKSLTKGLIKYNKLKQSYILCKSYQFNKNNMHRGPHYIPFYALDFILEE